MNKKIGTSMSNIVTTKKAIDKKNIQLRKSNERMKRANICIGCSSNNEGYCNRHLAWCGKVNYICLGIENPYKYKAPKATGKCSKRKNKELNKLTKKFQDNPNKVIEKLKKKYKIK